MLFTPWSYMNMHIWHTDIPHIYIMYIIYMCILYTCVCYVYIYTYIYMTYIFIYTCVYTSWLMTFISHFCWQTSSTVLPSLRDQEFISEISGIASGEFALEQQLQKARWGFFSWVWHGVAITLLTKNSTMANKFDSNTQWLNNSWVLAKQLPKWLTSCFFSLFCSPKWLKHEDSSCF